MKPEDAQARRWLSPDVFAGHTRGPVGMEFPEVIRYFGALFLVLALIGGAGLAMRRFGVPDIAGGKGRRLAVVESLMLGPKHRLFLVRCDDVEHILVLGPQGATLVDSAAASLALAAPAPAHEAAA